MSSDNPIIDKIKPFWDLTLVISDDIDDKSLMDWDAAKKSVDMFLNQLTEEVIKVTITFILKKGLDNFELIKKVIEYTESFDRFKNYSGNIPIYAISIHQSEIDENKIEYFKTLGSKLHISLQTYGYDVDADILYNDRNNAIYTDFKQLVALSAKYGVKVSLTSIIRKRNVKYFAKVLLFLYDYSGFYNYSIFDHNDYWENEDIEYLTQDIIKLQKHTTTHSCNFSVANINQTCTATNPYGIDSCCGAGICGFAVIPNGNIYPCHKCYNSIFDDDLFLMGNIYNGIDIKKREFIFEKNNYEIFPKRCRECKPEIRNRCYVCFATNYYVYGKFSTIPKEFCAFQKNLYNELTKNLSPKSKGSLK
ncbi:MAG: hypothetical protein ACM3KR_02310 [Deltaproteobacteria bacterium]